MKDLKAHREHVGWTQKQAADALGLSIAQVSAIENRRSRVTKTVEKLFLLYGRFDVPNQPTQAGK